MVNLVNGHKGTPEMECLNIYTDKWVVRWGFKDSIGDESMKNQITYLEKVFVGKPSLVDIQKTITAHYNNLCSNEILRGLMYEDSVVWLSTENQFNYKSVFDFAVQSGGENLPVRFKFGNVENQNYRVFTTIEDLKEFVGVVIEHINDTINKYWVIKDNIDWSKYDI